MTTTRETADHAELAAELRAFEGSDDLGNGDFTVCEFAADALEALLSEIAALRGEVAEWRETVRFNERCWSEERGHMIDRFTQVERQRDEAVGLLRLFDDHLGEDEPMWTDDSAVTGEWIGSDGIRHSLTFGMFRRVRAFLANQGADQ